MSTVSLLFWVPQEIGSAVKANLSALGGKAGWPFSQQGWLMNPSLWCHRHSHPLRGPCLGFIHLGLPGRVFQQFWKQQHSLGGNPVPELCPNNTAQVLLPSQLWALLVTLPGSQCGGDGAVGMSCGLGWGCTGSLHTAEICPAPLKDLGQDLVTFG